MASANHPKISSHRLIAFLEILFVATSLPITIIATRHTVSLNPKAFNPNATSSSTASSLNLNTHLLNQTINCRVNEPCTTTFEGTGTDADGQLSMSIDFLPSKLTQNTCQPISLVNTTSLNCSFSGSPTRPGEFKLLVTLKNQHDQAKTQVVTLNVR
jgi:hypothetical protein